MKEFCLYSEKKINQFLNEMFINFEIHNISLETIKKNNFINQNVLLIVSEAFEESLQRSFYKNNNVAIFYTTNNSSNRKNLQNIKTFNKHININKFIDEITTFFVKNSIIYGDIKLQGEKIINSKTEKEISLTPLEKDILTLLIDQQEAEKILLLEGVLKIKKETETKTIESHLTRIRNKLLNINSKLNITSKGNKVFLNFLL
tara:strand:- start:308 stop:916 length:609 start_codon:yes stop_codon:yes gene_type:complete